MKVIKTLSDAIKMRLLHILLKDLCNQRHSGYCKDCKSYMSWNPTSRPLCAQCCVIDQALEKWGKVDK